MRVLEVRDLEKSFSGKKIINKINLEIDEGEIVGFVGDNGAGKTTTFKLITNLIYPDSGQITIAGHDLVKERENALSNISAIIENPGLYKFLSGREHMDFIRKIRGVSKEKMDSVIESIGLLNRIDDKVKSYSLGMKQRLALGMCLLTEAKILLLDEPTNGLDPSGIIELRNLITSLSKEKNISIFFSSHQLSEVNKICDRVIFIKNGEIISVKDNKTNGTSQFYKIYLENTLNAEKLLKDCTFLHTIKVIDNTAIFIKIKENSLPEIIKLLTMNDIYFSDIEKSQSNVEEDYNEIYKENF